jgi:2,3-diaminopropionate biosynthesis protein SbnB
MHYLTEADVHSLPRDWQALGDTVEDALACFATGRFSQPIKQYLRWGDRTNRIIAMPAYLGGGFNLAGIKWIAGFPENPLRGLPRANSVLVLNDADTGMPVCIINSGLLSAIRATAVSALVLRRFMECRKIAAVRVGLVGLGPVGKCHLEMCMELLKGRAHEILVYDIRDFQKEGIALGGAVKWADSWQEAFDASDVFITCTAGGPRYVNRRPKDGALLLNVSLRDYSDGIRSFIPNIVVDSWEEVCREDTDVERMYLYGGLRREDVRTLSEFLSEGGLERIAQTETIMVNPMGLALFDVAIASHYYAMALGSGKGIRLA